jgi:hypothetical protein
MMIENDYWTEMSQKIITRQSSRIFFAMAIGHSPEIQKNKTAASQEGFSTDAA